MPPMPPISQQLINTPTTQPMVNSLKKILIDVNEHPANNMSLYTAQAYPLFGNTFNQPPPPPPDNSYVVCENQFDVLFCEFEFL